MTKIFANGGFRDEDWTRIGLEDELPETGNLLVPLSRYLEAPERFAGNTRAFGVVIAPGEDVELLGGHLDAIPLIAVDFPAFSDGRGFSAARVLREHLGYEGDIRALGKYILDQVPMLRRCGVTSFEITKPEVLKALEAGEWPEVTNYLQPVGSVAEIPAGTRPWARKPVRSQSQAAE
ncbi:DUF934 domain-containing protein [Roseibium aestuarii]|uniref:DUF934 domain-containing protein n=1 Tax=Roseibium aestuarii TaxID=2600299 RepID=A0ABW4JXA8_9HYPH|nr:DUF934 domain-containing protein [Roseibium aestuarii]